jgi:hypothetical protein
VRAGKNASGPALTSSLKAEFDRFVLREVEGVKPSAAAIAIMGRLSVNLPSRRFVNGGHFGLLHYSSQLFDQAAHAQRDFLLRVLL